MRASNEGLWLPYSHLVNNFMDIRLGEQRRVRICAPARTNKREGAKPTNGHQKREAGAWLGWAAGGLGGWGELDARVEEG